LESESSGPIFINPHQDVAFSPLLVVLLLLSKEKSSKKNLPALLDLISKATVRLLFLQSTPAFLINLVEANLNSFPKEFAKLSQVEISKC